MSCKIVKYFINFFQIIILYSNGLSINFTPNKSQCANSNANSDIIYAFFKYSNPFFTQNTLLLEIKGSPVDSAIVTVTQFS